MREPPGGVPEGDAPDPAWLEAAPGPVLLFEGDRVAVTTPAAGAELGVEPGRLVGRGFHDALVPEAARRLDAVLAELAAGDRGEERLTLTTRRDLRAAVIDLRLRPLGAGRVAALAIDATEQHRLDAVVGHLATSTFAVDEGGRMIWRPPGNAERFGVADEEVLGVTTLEWIHPEDLPELLRLFTSVISSPGNRLEAALRTRQPYVEDGWITTRITGVNALDDPRVRGVVVRAEELTATEIVDSVGHTAGRFNSLADAAPIGILVTDRAGRVVYRNELAEEILGDDHDWIGQARPRDRDELTAVIDRALEEQQEGEVLAAFDRHSGTRWVSLRAVPQTDELGRPFGLIATLQDVTKETEAKQELAVAQDRLWHLANHDQLTGLPNRSLLMDRMEQAMARHRRDGHGVAVLYCDLDGFKKVNDEHGHAAGDQVLIEVARRMGEATRDTDTVCRFGGDEFLVLVESFGHEDEVQEVAQRIITEVSRPLTAVPGARVGVTIGVAVGSGDRSTGALLAQADNAMYRAKARGKGRYEVYG